MKPELEQKTSGQEDRQSLSFTPGIYTLGDKVYYLAGDGFFHPTYLREGKWLYSVSERCGLEGEKSQHDFVGEIVKRSGFLLNNPRGRFLALAGTALGVAGGGTLAWVLSKMSKETSSQVLTPTLPPQLLTKTAEQKEFKENKDGILLDVPVYWQEDPRWDDEILGKNPAGSEYTIGGYGCVITSYAMLLTALGQSEDPLTLNEKLKEARGVFAEGSGNFNPGPGEKALELTRVWRSKYYRKKPVADETLKEVRGQLNEQRPVLSYVNKYDDYDLGYFKHYVLVVGWRYDTDAKEVFYIFNDPLYGKQRELSEKQFAEKAIYFRSYDVILPTVDIAERQEREIKEKVAIPESSISPLFTDTVRYWGPKIEKWAKKHDIDPNLAATVMQIESCGYRWATSPSSAKGLFQVMPFHFGPGEDPYHPSTNAKRGLSYLRKALDAHNANVRLALAGYNGGIAGSQKGEDEWTDQMKRYVYWGLGIYEDTLSGKKHSERLNEWLAKGGASLCEKAQKGLGLSP